MYNKRSLGSLINFTPSRHNIIAMQHAILLKHSTGTRNGLNNLSIININSYTFSPFLLILLRFYNIIIRIYHILFLKLLIHSTFHIMLLISSLRASSRDIGEVIIQSTLSSTDQFIICIMMCLMVDSIVIRYAYPKSIINPINPHKRQKQFLHKADICKSKGVRNK